MAEAPTLKLPAGYSLDSLFVEWPDAPIADFDRTVRNLAKTDTVYDCDRLNELIDGQHVCGIIVKHHGNEGLARVIKAIAEASVKLDVRMKPRVQSIADFYGIGE